MSDVQSARIEVHRSPPLIHLTETAQQIIALVLDGAGQTGEHE